MHRNRHSLNAVTQPGMVYLVGAGPGDPGLLTVRAAALIATADCILHDDLVASAVLEHARDSAEIVNVGKRCGHKKVSQEWINAEMIRYASEHKSVVRLKSGDPMLFGRGTEEMHALSRAGVAFEVVPGITAAFAAASSLQISLTDRSTASRLIFLTGHHSRHDPLHELWEKDQNPMADATLVLYMPGSNFAELAARLRDAGVAADAMCYVVSHAGWPSQSSVTVSLSELSGTAPLPSPSVLIVHAAPRRA